MGDPDPDFSPEDERRRKLLEAHMLNCGYRRDAHGFWCLPGSAAWFAAPEVEDDTGEER